MSTQNHNHSALIVIDLQNDIIHPDGKLGGCAKMAAEARLIEKVNTAVQSARSKNWLIIFIRVGFSADYVECPTTSPLFSYVQQAQALQLNSWGAEFHKDLVVQQEDTIVTKHRVGAFYGTSLPTILTAHRIEHLALCGVSTDFAVQTIAREAHDRDYRVSIIQDACAANSVEEHKASMHMLEKFTHITNTCDL